MLSHRLMMVRAHTQQRCAPITICGIIWITLSSQGCSPNVAGANWIGGSLASGGQQSRLSAEEGESISSPKIVLDRTTYDFGRIRPGSKQKAIFKLANAGGSTLRITDVQKCCGAIITLDKKELPTGESAILTAEYASGQVAGTIRKQIGLVTNDPANPQLQLTIIGQMVQTLVWAPAHFQIGDHEDKAGAPEISIKSLDGTPFSIKGFTATSQAITADYDPNRRATEFTLKPAIDMTKIRRLASQTGKIAVTLDHPDYTTITLSFDVIQSLQATPVQILAFDARHGGAIQRKVQVRDNGVDPNTADPVAVSSVTAKNGSRVGLRGVTPRKAGCDLDLEIWPAKSNENEAFCSDQLVVKLRDGRELTVPLRVFYQSPAVSSTTGQGN